MFLKSKILVLFLALCVFAAQEILTKSSPVFSVTGVTYQKVYNSGAFSFSYKKLFSGKGVVTFSWTLPSVKAEKGKLSFYTVSGKLLKSFEIASNEGCLNWNMNQSKIASGVYFATLTYGQYKKSLKVLY